MTEEAELIKTGDWIVIQRQKYTKLHKFSTADTVCALGKDQIELKNIIGHVYCKTFKMIPKSEVQKKKHKQKLFELEPCDSSDNLKVILETKEKGVDNRNIHDDNKSQHLTQVFEN